MYSKERLIKQDLLLSGKSQITVNQFIKRIDKPIDYLSNVKFNKTVKNEINLHEKKQENIYVSLVGSAIDYLTRFTILGTTKEESFFVSLKGAKILGEEKQAQKLLAKIDNNLDDISIINACKLVGYDVCYRQSLSLYKDVNQINANKETIENIRNMLNFSRSFLLSNKNQNCYSGLEIIYKNSINSIIRGDLDFIIGDTLWDMKVSTQKYFLTKEVKMQLLIYYLLGQKSLFKTKNLDYENIFSNVKYLGIINPRQFISYKTSIAEIDEKIIQKIWQEIEEI